MLEIRELTTTFKVGSDVLTAVDGVSFTVSNNQVVGIVGESGSGKSVTALSILRLLAANGSIARGSVIWNGQDLTRTSDQDYQRIRGPEIGLIFQNPLAALNPVFTIGNQFIETIRRHHPVSKAEARDRAIQYLRDVQIPDAEQRLDDYPHQFSIGMCQRILIAITLSMQPKLLIADEPTASLDMTVQAQILALLGQLRQKYEMSVLLITHDLGVVAQTCDEVVVMYLGKVMETGSVEAIFQTPQHPYTQALLSAIPKPDPAKAYKPQLIKGEVPSLFHLPRGCRFQTRCPVAQPRCSDQLPGLEPNGPTRSACFFPGSSGSKSA